MDMMDFIGRKKIVGGKELVGRFNSVGSKWNHIDQYVIKNRNKIDSKDLIDPEHSNSLNYY